MRQCVPMDAELQAPHAAIALRRCRTAKGRPGERRRLAASDEIYDRETSVPGIRLEPARAGLSVRPRQSCGESDEDRHDDNGHQQRVSRHHAPPGVFEGHYLRPMPGVIDRDQKSESAVESLSGRGQGLDARRIDQADTAVNDGDRSVAFKLGEGATDGLDGQAEIIGDVLAAHRKWNRVGRPLERE